MNEFRVLVCGGRDYDDRTRFFHFMDRVLETIKGTGETPKRDVVIIHGAARGADTLADDYARERELRVIRYLADWKTHGRGAGPIRNKLMLTDGKPHVIIAFKGGNGTADMIQQGKKAGVPVYEVKNETAE
jgi:hypothetical protein